MCRERNDTSAKRHTGSLKPRCSALNQFLAFHSSLFYFKQTTDEITSIVSRFMVQEVAPDKFGAGLVRPREPEPTVSNTSASDSPHRSTHSVAYDQGRAKRYARTRIALGLLGTALYVGLTLIFVQTGITTLVEEFARSSGGSDYVVLLLFAAILGAIEIIVSLPLKYYSGFHLEHKYGLSNQSFWMWVWEGAKGLLIGVPIMMPILLILYYCLRNFGVWWWLPVGAFTFLVSVVLARLAPVLIFPLFYKFKPLEEGELKHKLLTLCENVGMAVQGVFVFDMSKNTKKANAAFTGIGKSKRIILGDTLLANFNDEEIESIFAHELGHYKLRHIWMMMFVGTLSSFLGLYVTAQAYQASLFWFGFGSIDQIAALPLLGLWLGLYSLVTSPLSNMLSRAHERAADRFAVRFSGKKPAFVGALRKLAGMNLADASPHPLIEFLFHSHPSIEKRIRLVERMELVEV